MIVKFIHSETRELVHVDPGDCLLYRPKGKFGWIISIKTFSMIGHCECYVGNDKSIASRDGKGVNLYDFRMNELCYVLKPPEVFNLNKAYDWFENSARGQGYDWLGLLRFGWRTSFVPEKLTENKQFCSEFLARFYNKGDWFLFNKVDCDEIVPKDFLRAPFLNIVKILEQ